MPWLASASKCARKIQWRWSWTKWTTGGYKYDANIMCVQCFFFLQLLSLSVYFDWSWFKNRNVNNIDFKVMVPRITWVENVDVAIKIVVVLFVYAFGSVAFIYSSSVLCVCICCMLWSLGLRRLRQHCRWSFFLLLLFVKYYLRQTVWGEVFQPDVTVFFVVVVVTLCQVNAHKWFYL